MHGINPRRSWIFTHARQKGKSGIIAGVGRKLAEVGQRRSEWEMRLQERKKRKIAETLKLG